MDKLDDTLPIIIALPVFVWLEWPWKLIEGEWTLSFPLIGLASALMIVGVLSSFVFLMGLAWCVFLWSWIQQRVSKEYRKQLIRLMVLPLMAFPWVTLDTHVLGWWFRLSGAWATSQMLTLMNFDVIHQGTQMMVNQIPISVDPSCAGLNTLQSMLIAGSVLAYILLGEGKGYWFNLLLLIAIAWVANTIRIITLSLAAIFVSPEFAMGAFHDIGGWFVLVVMFSLCWGIFSLQAPPTKPTAGAT